MKRLKRCVENAESIKNTMKGVIILSVMTIYEELLDLVCSGKRFKIDFKKRNMRVGNKWLIKDGEWDLERELIKFEYNNPVDNFINDWCLAKISLLYRNYKYSTPSEKSELRRQKNYFYALPSEKMSDKELITGKDREYARAALEGFILCAILAGWLTWDEHKMGKWFYRGKDEDLIILREWIEEK